MRRYTLLPSLLTLLTLVFALGGLEAQAQEGSSSLKVDHYLEWELVQNPQLSPDATQ